MNFLTMQDRIRKGNTFNRRVINAKTKCNALWGWYKYLCRDSAGTKQEDCIYIPSLTIRSEMKSKVLAGTVFYRDTPYR